MTQKIARTATQVKRLPAPTVKRLLREAGYSMSDVAGRRGCYPSAVSRTIRKQMASDPIWVDVTWCINHPSRGA